MVFITQALHTGTVLDCEQARLYHFGMSPLTQFRKRARLSQGALAELVGTSQPQIQRLETGDRGLSRDWAIRIAPHVGAAPEELMFGGRTVPLVGYVGAGSEANYYAEGQGGIGLAKMPPGGSESTVAVQIRGDSLGAPFDGWVIYYQERRDPPTDDLLGQLCVVGLPSGQVLVKQLMRGRIPGHFDLWSTNAAPRTDEPVVWAAPVTAILPAGLAIIEESQVPAVIPKPKRGRKK